jgi:hypothetical protein
MKGTVARFVLVCSLVAALALSTFAFVSIHAIAHADGPSVSGLHVQGNQLVNSSGQTIRLLGVDHSGTEFACVQGSGIFDGQTDDNAIATMASWHINVVRVPLNEDCWLNINGASPAGATYQQAVADYVNRLNNHGLAVILDLHWNAPGGQKATSQQPMPDEDHAPAFWSSVASYFKGNSSVIFDLYNEPYPDNNQNTTIGWQCWRNGGSCSGVSYQVAGMQELVNTVRQTGASNVLMLGGLEYSNALSQWLAYKPTDPDNNLAASWHSYNFNLCNNSGCWDSTIAPVAQQVPVIAGEIGENDCAHGYIDGLMNWMDSHGISYLGWTWNTWDCSSGPALITDYNGTPTAFGVGFRDHLASLAGSGGNPPPPTPTPAPGSSCKVSYVVQNQWQGGFTGNITITNTGSSTINGWTLQFNFPSGQQVTDSWNGQFSQQGSQVTVKNVDYNGQLAPGATATPGFNASWNGSNPNPTSFTLNGAMCS